MVFLDFSINNLTLMALTIATGFVVDDAIVVIENISRYIEKGEKPLAAALKGAGEIGFTIISLTFSLIAVLIPLLFMGDIVGRLFREFAITLAVAILISAVVSLTLTPMMCARMLSQESLRKQNRFSRASEKMFDRIIAAYGRGLAKVLNHPWLTLSVALSTLLLSVLLSGTGQRHYSGHFAGTAIQLLCQYGPAATPGRGRDFAGSGSAKSDLICWR